MRIAYVAGPYRADTPSGIMHNIQRASDAAEILWKSGYAVICPHRNSAFFDGIVPDEQFLKGGLRLIKMCDVIFPLPGWRDSAGSVAELEFAEKHGIEINYMLSGEEL